VRLTWGHSRPCRARRSRCSLQVATSGALQALWATPARRGSSRNDRSPKSEMVSAHDRSFDSRDLSPSSRPKRFGEFPVERLGDGGGRVEPQGDAALPRCLRGIGRWLGVGDVEVAVAQRRHGHGHRCLRCRLDVAAGHGEVGVHLCSNLRRQRWRKGDVGEPVRMTSAGPSPARADSCQPSGRLPSERTRRRTRSTFDAYRSCGIPWGSAPPMWVYGLGKIPATPASTVSICSKVAGSSGSSHTVWCL
jgi:hypothetical protein